MIDILDSHTHTLASGHAYNTITEMAYAAKEKGLELLGITEHAPQMPGSCHEFYFSNLRIVEREMYGIELLLGVELNIIDYKGTVDLDPSILRRMDVAIASLHTPCIKYGTKEQNTSAVIGAIKNPYVNIIGHPDDNRYPLDYEAVVSAAKEYGVLLELNNSSLSPTGSRVDPVANDIEMLRLCKEKSVPIILGSDAHTAALVGSHEYAIELLNKVAFPEELVVNRSVTEFKKYVNKYKNGGL